MSNRTWDFYPTKFYGKISVRKKNDVFELYRNDVFILFSDNENEIAEQILNVQIELILTDILSKNIKLQEFEINKPPKIFITDSLKNLLNA
jgi:hypothetical protein